MWRSTTSEPNGDVEVSASPGGRRSLFGGKGKASTDKKTKLSIRGGAAGDNSGNSPNLLSKLLETRNDAEAQRTLSPEDQATQRRKKKWLMLKKGLATKDEGGDTTLQEPESSRSLSGGSAPGSNLFIDQRQTKVVVHQFSSGNPKEVMKIEREDSVPIPEARSHVLVRVEV
jgi:hypothetical protein